MNLRTEDCSLHPRRSLSLAVLLSFVALITETLGSKATVSPIWVYRDNKIVNVPNNNYQNFSGNAISIKSEDLPNGISIKGQMIDEIKPAEFDLPLLTGVKDFSVIGDNAIRFENGTSLTVGLVSRSQSGSLAVKTAFTRHDLGTNLKLVTDFYATSGKGVGTYVQLLNNVTNNSLTLVVTDFKDLNLAISLPVQQATLGSLEMDDSKSTVVYGLAIGLNNGDKQIYSFGFDLQNPSVILNASWATRVLADWTPVSVTWALPGSAFVFNYKTQSKGKIVYYRTDWGSFGDLSAVEVYSYGVDNDVYISTLCGIELLIADPIKKSLYSYWIGPRSYTIEYKYLDYGVDTIVAMSCNVHGNLEVIAKAASGERKMIIFKLDSDNFGPYDVHSVTPVDSAVSTVASISPINYDGSLSPEIFLTMGFRLGADLQKDNLNFFEVYKLGPHAVIDFSKVPANTNKIEFSYTMLEVNGTKILESKVGTSLNIVVQDTEVTITPKSSKKKTKIGAGKFYLNDLFDIKGYPDAFNVVNNSAVKVIEAFPAIRTLVNYTDNYVESTMSEKFIFAQTSKGLEIFDISTNKSVMPLQPSDCNPGSLKMVRNSLPIYGPVFYTICSKTVGSFSSQSIFVAYQKTTGEWRWETISFNRRGYNMAVLVRDVNATARHFVLVCANNQLAPVIETSLLNLGDDKATVLSTVRVAPQQISAIGQMFDVVFDKFSRKVYAFAVGVYSDVLIYQMFSVEDNQVSQYGLADKLPLPNGFEYHENNKIYCNNYLDEQNVECVFSGSMMNAYYANYTLGNNNFKFLSIPLISGIKYSDVTHNGIIGVFAGENMNPTKGSGAYADKYWIQIVNFSNITGITKVETSNVAAFKPTITYLPLTGQRFIYPGTPFKGALSVLDMSPAYIEVLSASEFNPNSFGQIEFLTIDGKVASAISLTSIFALPDPEPKPKEKSSIWLWVGIGFGAAVILVVVVFLIIRAKHHSSGHPYDEELADHTATYMNVDGSKLQPDSKAVVPA